MNEPVMPVKKVSHERDFRKVHNDTSISFPACESVVSLSDYSDACDEIDRLREELKEWKMSEKETRHCMAMEYKKLKKELEEAREYSEKVLKRYGFTDEDMPIWELGRVMWMDEKIQVLKKELDTWKEVAQSRDSFINSLNEQIIRLQEENKVLKKRWEEMQRETGDDLSDIEKKYPLPEEIAEIEIDTLDEEWGDVLDELAEGGE